MTQRAPLCAVALGLEFTHAGAGALLPLAVASALAFATGRVVTPAAADRST